MVYFPVFHGLYNTIHISCTMGCPLVEIVETIHGPRVVQWYVQPWTMCCAMVCIPHVPWAVQQYTYLMAHGLYRAWDSVHRVDDQIREAVFTYRTARQAIEELGGAADMKRFQEIKKSDLKMSGDIVEENRVGQRSSVFPWFWRLGRKVKEHCGDYEKECECRISRSFRVILTKHSL